MRRRTESEWSQFLQVLLSASRSEIEQMHYELAPAEHQKNMSVKTMQHDLILSAIMAERGIVDEHSRITVK